MYHIYGKYDNYIASISDKGEAERIAKENGGYIIED